MPYYQDLTPYEYMRLEGFPPGLNVGWLSIDHPFKNGIVPAETIAKFKALDARGRMFLAAGHHACEFCPHLANRHPAHSFEYEGETFFLGSAEIWVTSSAGICYVAPNLIIHYIEAHQYLPPEEFIQAVLQMPLPSK